MVGGPHLLTYEGIFYRADEEVQAHPAFRSGVQRGGDLRAVGVLETSDANRGIPLPERPNFPGDKALRDI